MFALNFRFRYILHVRANIAPCIEYQIKSIGYIDNFLIRLMICLEFDSEHIMVAYGVYRHINLGQVITWYI